ncbi:TPM domain-containing protein [Trichloromonas sp.]|uniref:TPM domain-containing protein n=1 Tax=Trichloromonas sp. TaxID=3069249 RepID=UPI002A49042C|nr:TPM domain-containing protein [Trichloromonas sp.]
MMKSLLIPRIIPWVLLLVFLVGCPNRQELPLVDDRAGLFAPERVERLTAYHDRLLQDLGIHFHVNTLDQSPGDLDQLAVELFEELRLGETTAGARGVLLLVDPQGGQARLEIGYDLEGIFPDGFVGYVEREQMTPFFAADRVADGIEATVELLVGRALGEVPADYHGAVELEHLSGGGGARVDVAIGSGSAAKTVAEDRGRFAAQPTPRQTLERYLEVLRTQVKDPELGLYTPETRAFFAKWLVTDAQQDNERKTLEANLPTAEERIAGDLAVLRFPVDNRQAAPYLLRQSAEGWQLDMAAMSRLIGFNHKNQWFFRAVDHEFIFAFDDVKFDANGFPYR